MIRGMTSLHNAQAALDAARNHYAAALVAHDYLVSLYDRASVLGERVDPTEVAAANDAVRFGFKAGELAASIAIASDLIAAGDHRDLLEQTTAGKTAARVRMAVQR